MNNLDVLSLTNHETTIESSNLYKGHELNISNYSTTSNALNDIWILDNYYNNINHSNDTRKFNFTHFTDTKTRFFAKKYIHSCLLKSMPIYTLIKRFSALKYFILYIFEKHTITDINQINPIIIENYYDYLIKKNIVCATKRARWYSIKEFFYFNDYQDFYNQMNKYSFSDTINKSNSEQYISEFVAEQLDKVFLDESLPLNYRTLYWLLRLYPGRVNEYLSAKIECIKEYVDNTYIFTTVSSKTSSRDENGMPKLLYIDTTENMQQMLVRLIKEQQFVARNVVATYPEYGEFLFLSPRYRYFKSLQEYRSDDFMGSTSSSGFNLFLDSIIKRYGIKEEDGSFAMITSHKFRHKSITDRIESKLFRPIDLLPLTNHSTTKEINDSYYHPQNTVEKSEDIRKFLTNETVVFKGKVINSTNDIVFERFLRNPFAYSLKDMGICTDSRDCSKDKLHCLGCNYFIPDCKNLDYFQYQLKDWKNKYRIAEQMGNSYMQENSKYNIKLHEAVVEKIKSITDRKQE